MSTQGDRHTALSLAAMLPTNRKEATAILSELHNLVEWQAGHQAPALRLIPITVIREKGVANAFGGRKIGAAATVAACIICLGIGWMIEPPIAGAGRQACALGASARVSQHP
jgi:hypothetical protein